jgi:hypothetical protein
MLPCTTQRLARGGICARSRRRETHGSPAARRRNRPLACEREDSCLARPVPAPGNTALIGESR